MPLVEAQTQAQICAASNRKTEFADGFVFCSNAMLMLFRSAGNITKAQAVV